MKPVQATLPLAKHPHDCTECYFDRQYRRESFCWAHYQLTDEIKWGPLRTHDQGRRDECPIIPEKLRWSEKCDFPTESATETEPPALKTATTATSESAGKPQAPPEKQKKSAKPSKTRPRANP